MIGRTQLRMQLPMTLGCDSRPTRDKFSEDEARLHEAIALIRARSSLGADGDRHRHHTDIRFTRRWRSISPELPACRFIHLAEATAGIGCLPRRFPGETHARHACGCRACGDFARCWVQRGPPGWTGEIRLAAARRGLRRSCRAGRPDR